MRKKRKKKVEGKKRKHLMVRGKAAKIQKMKKITNQKIVENQKTNPKPKKKKKLKQMTQKNMFMNI